MHHYHTTLMKNWVAATPATKKEGRNPLFLFIVHCTSRLQSLDVLRYVLLDASLDVAILSANKLLASYSLEQLDIALGDACNNLGCHVGYLLTLLTLEAILHQPLANELLRELLLLLALSEALLVTLLVEVAR